MRSSTAIFSMHLRADRSVFDCFPLFSSLSAKGLAESASALTSSTSQACLPCPADVRDPKAMVKAVEDCINKFGKIDFVICGSFSFFLTCSLILASEGVPGPY